MYKAPKQQNHGSIPPEGDPPGTAPTKVHQAMTKEQKVGIFLKRFLGTINQPKIQASLHHLLCLFPMGCSQGNFHHFHGTAGRGGDAGEDAGETWGGHPPYVCVGGCVRTCVRVC